MVYTWRTFGAINGINGYALQFAGDTTCFISYNNSSFISKGSK